MKSDPSSADKIASSYDYQLPENYIAQTPVTPRDHSRLLVVDSPTTHHHQYFYDLPQWLKSGDLLVLNNTKVIPARIYGHKVTGAAVEVLLLEEKSYNCRLALVKPGKRLQVGAKIRFSPHNFESKPVLEATVIEKDEATGGRVLEFDLPPETPLLSVLDDYGEIPFPPYVTEKQAQPEQYQTVYAQQAGAVAAPTAGLHFTDRLLRKLSHQGIAQAEVTLHVGVGTFRPVEVETITEHTMHQEWINVPAETVDKIRATKAQGGRVIAVGTTVVRALEGAVAAQGNLGPFCGKTDLFIYPGYEIQVVDGLITNFHLPRSSLLMLVSAFVGRKRLLSLYEDAIARQYRFYSFGDAMLII
ncbi:MAG: tRNA preQ1(34) S-adenosylmethionine ribosyltransferase-isomerase QueA [Cyanobacteria bacterium SW_9_44_58]|nr:MAG: tRNA preQ1(34) S-adenosylmethionine ribosyltransferase-isomerase QueA [Cyanobacteria bacterium SW_9_44_58]